MTVQSQSKISVAGLRKYLDSIGFHQLAEVGQTRAFRHDPSDTIVTLTGVSEDDDSVRPADLLSIVTRLEAKDIVPASAISQIQNGKIPAAS